MRTDVAIVGAGLAGLETARRLWAHGVDAVAFEARRRPGGRIHAVGAHRLEAGPAWFWAGQMRIESLARRYGLSTFRQPSAGAALFEDAAGKLLRDPPFEIHQGAHRVAGGPSALIDAMIADAPEGAVRLAHQVKTVEATGAGVALDIKSDDGPTRIDAKWVVIAAPSPVVRRDIAFSPPLSDAEHAALTAQPTWMAASAKAFAVYDRPFWREVGLSGDAISQRGPLQQIFDASPAAGGVGALGGFVGYGPQDRARLGQAELTRRVVTQLVRLFGEGAAAPIETHLVDWASEPLTATDRDLVASAQHPAYSPQPALVGLASRRILFAPTELAPEHGGLLEGALAAGETAARRILKSAIRISGSGYQANRATNK